MASSPSVHVRLLDIASAAPPLMAYIGVRTALMLRDAPLSPKAAPADVTRDSGSLNHLVGGSRQVLATVCPCPGHYPYWGRSDPLSVGHPRRLSL